MREGTNQRERLIKRVSDSERENLLILPQKAPRLRPYKNRSSVSIPRVRMSPEWVFENAVFSQGRPATRRLMTEKSHLPLRLPLAWLTGWLTGFPSSLTSRSPLLPTPPPPPAPLPILLGFALVLFLYFLFKLLFSFTLLFYIITFLFVPSSLSPSCTSPMHVSSSYSFFFHVSFEIHFIYFF